jgi:Putative transposase of IS4/5 family (DUF4096)
MKLLQLGGVYARFNRRSGAPWRDLPEQYGPRTTCYNRFVRWRKAGVWAWLMDANHHRARRRHPDAADHCLGRSRGGLTTKIHVVAFYGLIQFWRLTSELVNPPDAGLPLLQSVRPLGVLQIW